MSSADFYIGWKNSTDGVVLSRRSPQGRRMPSFSTNQAAVLVPLQVPASPWASLAFSFARPLTVESTTIQSTSRIIFAIGNTAVSSIDNPRSDFSQHSIYAELAPVNFLASGSTGGGVVNGSVNVPAAILSSSPKQYANVLLAHGLLFFLAWTVAPFIGIFVARYLKNALGVWWYRLHVGIMFAITGLFSIASFLLIFLYKKPAHFNSIHTVSSKG